MTIATPPRVPRVGVVIDDPQQPAWIARTIRAIGDSVAYVALKPGPRSSPSRNFAERLYDRFDRAFFRGGDDASRLETIALFGDAKSMVDILLDFTATPAPAAWTIRLGDTLGAFVRQDETTDALLVADGRPIARARASTDPMSLRRGVDRLLWKCSAMIVAAVAQGHGETGDLALPPPMPISTPRMLRTLIASVMRYLARQVRRRIRREQWFVSFTFDAKEEDFAKFHRVMPPRDRFWADPFVIADGDRAHLFVEELVYSEKRGTLAVIEIRADGSHGTAKRILEKPYHLSYPCVFRWNGEHFMLPETGEHGTLELYRATDFPLQWELDGVLMRDTRAVDATIFEEGGRWWLFFSTAPDGFTYDQLHLFHADTPRGPWTPHPRNPIVTDVTIGRCAGRPFRRDGRLYRAAQNGARRYGGSMNILEILTLTTTDYVERFDGSIDPWWLPGLNATHTLNFDGNVTVIDAARYLWSPSRLFGRNRA